ncbi:uncharacterized protein [Spinacia oleracea]|uniref:Uncharacterized protein isoform X1 n=1 Tax=Spinacia oleracea TaxID=3562 RepID=A0ABM3QMB7_SPIOL|nr:uncharacterized protein LOC110784421 isoform X1 [Spinacia oleracea]XP_056684506.1 uncharacterized protein LOC110784421 isoform X1 [Spinacia oleracea]
MVLSVIQTQLLIQAHLTRETADLPPTLNGDLKRVLELAPRLLEELMKVFGVVFSCTGAASCCVQGVGCAPDVCRVFCRESRSTGSVVFDCCCVQSYIAYPFIAFGC